MARQTKRSSLPMVLLVLALALVGFGVYLWNFDYKPNPKNVRIDPEQKRADAVPVKLTGSVILVKPSPAERGAWKDGQEAVAEFRIKNDGEGPCLILDSPATDLLYGLTLVDPAGRTRTARFPGGIRRLNPDKPDEHYRILELLPGRSLCVTFPLHKHFKFKKAGLYTLRVAYKPSWMANMLRLNLIELGVTERLYGSMEVPFELGQPKKKTLPAPGHLSKTKKPPPTDK